MTLKDTIQTTENQKRLIELLTHTYMHEGDSPAVAAEKAQKRLIQRYGFERRGKSY